MAVAAATGGQWPVAIATAMATVIGHTCRNGHYDARRPTGGRTKHASRYCTFKQHNARDQAMATPARGSRRSIDEAFLHK